MFSTTHSHPRFFRLLVELTILALFIFLLGALTNVHAQRKMPTLPKASAPTAAAPAPTATDDGTAPGAPLIRDYKGIRIGMTAEEVRQTLGEPTDKGETQDFYAFSEKEMAQVFYDKAHHVKAISVNYLADAAPASQKVIGMLVEAREDGSCYKMVKYPKEGFWITYNRTSGQDPLVTVVMQKMPTP